MGGAGIGDQSQLDLRGGVGKLCRCRETVLGQVEGSQHGGGPLNPGGARWGALQGLGERGHYLGGAGEGFGVGGGSGIYSLFTHTHKQCHSWASLLLKVTSIKL